MCCSCVFNMLQDILRLYFGFDANGAHRVSLVKMTSGVLGLDVEGEL